MDSSFFPNFDGLKGFVDTNLPSTGTVVFVLLSVKNGGVVIVGTTKNLMSRLNEINTMSSSPNSTDDAQVLEYHPYYVVAYITCPDYVSNGLVKLIERRLCTYYLSPIIGVSNPPWIDFLNIGHAFVERINIEMQQLNEESNSGGFRFISLWKSWAPNSNWHSEMFQFRLFDMIIDV